MKQMNKQCLSAQGALVHGIRANSKNPTTTSRILLDTVTTENELKDASTTLILGFVLMGKC